MASKQINIGLPTQASTADSLQAAFGKINSIFSGLDTASTVSDTDRSKAGNPVGDAINLRFDKSSGNTTERTGFFWSNWRVDAAGGLPAPTGRIGAVKIQRIQDRYLGGLAALSSSDFPATTKDPLEVFEGARSDPRGFRTSWSQMSVGSENGGIAINGYAFASSLNDPAFAGIQLGMGGCFTSVNDNVDVQQLMTGMYAVAFRRPGAGVMSGTGTCGAEIDIANEGNSLQISPASTYPAGGFTTALQLNSGAISPFATDASAALTIGFNGAKFLSGIVVGQNAIAGVTVDANNVATGGYGSFIRTGAFTGIEWWNSNGTAATSTIVSEQLSPANAQSIRFQDTGIVLGGAALQGRSFEAIYVGANTGAWLTVAPAYGTKVCTISTGGTTNADLAIRAAGSGLLVLDKASNTTTSASPGTSGAPPQQVAGYMMVKIGDSGQTVKIPYYL
jgi:hypothetical protein